MLPYFQYFLLGLFLMGFSGCVSHAVQTEAFLSAPTNLPRFQKIETVPFIDQTEGYCGPATLTMAMRWAGENISVDETAAQIYTPLMKGSFQSDLISASRRRGLMAVPLHDLQSLFKEVAAGHPVIVFENLSVKWLPQWHYALVLGYDLETEEVIMHSGHDAFFRWDLRKFERSWMLGDYWGLVVLPAGQLTVSGNEISHVIAAVGLEQAQQLEAAKKSYKKILEKWPTSLVALIGLSNIAYQEGNRKEAIRLLKKATKAHPDSIAAVHNLAVAQSSQR